MRSSILAATLLIVAAILVAGRAHAITPAIVSSGTHTLALDANGMVYAWGSDSLGQLGQGRIINRPTPTRVTGVPGITHFVEYVDGGNSQLALINHQPSIGVASCLDLTRVL